MGIEALWPFVFGGGGIVGVGALLISALQARNALQDNELIQWHVRAENRSAVGLMLVISPVGKVRDVRILVGVPPQVFHPERFAATVWEDAAPIAMWIDLPETEQGKLFAFIGYRSSVTPRWTHETWLPVLDEGEAADCHLRQESAHPLVRYWRWMTQAPTLAVPHGVTYRRSSPGRRRRQLRRSQREGGTIPDPRSRRKFQREQRQQAAPLED